ncbi:MAG: DUF839 domain-containing protein [Pseudomonadota bacterium]
MLKPNHLATAIAAALLTSGIAIADGNRGFNFKPIAASANSADWNATAPWKVPQGFSQYVVADENSLNIYDGGRDDWHDMNTVNETGKQAGRHLYTTHEVRDQPEGGSVSVVDLKTGKAKLLWQDSTWNAIDGIRWTPWGTLLVAEEVEGGRLFEIFLNDDLVSAREVVDRPAVGRIAHEGIDVDRDGNVYVVDEHRGRSQGCSGVVPCGGGIYRFVPDSYGDLSAGSLYALAVDGFDGTGQGAWVGPIDPLTARAAGTAAGGQSYQRPEDIEVIGNTLYVAVTEGPRDAQTNASGTLAFTGELYDARVLAIDLQTLAVANFVKPGVNVPVEIGRPGDADFQTGFDSVDNLAEAPNGDLVMVEDNVPSDIWFASSRTDAYGASKRVDLFASLTDPEAEGTGIYFSPFDPGTLFVNVQHSVADDGDATWAITRARGHR